MSDKGNGDAFWEYVVEHFRKDRELRDAVEAALPKLYEEMEKAGADLINQVSKVKGDLEWKGRRIDIPVHVKKEDQ